MEPDVTSDLSADFWVSKGKGFSHERRQDLDLNCQSETFTSSDSFSNFSNLIHFLGKWKNRLPIRIGNLINKLEQELHNHSLKQDQDRETALIVIKPESLSTLDSSRRDAEVSCMLFGFRLGSITEKKGKEIIQVFSPKKRCDLTTKLKRELLRFSKGRPIDTETRNFRVELRIVEFSDETYDMYFLNHVLRQLKKTLVNLYLNGTIRYRRGPALEIESTVPTEDDGSCEMVIRGHRVAYELNFRTREVVGLSPSEAEARSYLRVIYFDIHFSPTPTYA